MKAIKLLIIIIAVLGLTNIFYANNLLNYSDEIRSLSQEINDLEKSNQHLRIQVAKLTSITSLAEKIDSAGYTDNPKISTIRIDNFVALNP